MDPVHDHPANRGVLHYLGQGTEPDQVTATRPPEDVDRWRLGAHPDVVAWLWDNLNAALPDDARYLIAGGPALVQPATGLVIAAALGTQYALRLADVPRREAMAAGAQTVHEFRTSGGTLDITGTFGPGWVFGFSDAREPEWLARSWAQEEAMSASTIRPPYDMWPQYNRRLRDVVAAMTDEQLAIRPAPDLLPIWATVGHTAAMRMYWLCAVIGESGADTTPFADATTDWADDLEHPRSAEELVEALDSTFRLVETCLETWTPDMLADTIHRDYGGTIQVHNRGSILQRLFSHDAYHCGELSQTLGIHGLPQIDLWRPD